MLPKTHILAGFLLSLFLLLIIPETSLIFASLVFLSSFLVDFDHYLYYAYKKRDYSPKRAIAYFKNKVTKFRLLSKKKLIKYYSGIYIFHGIEILIISFLLGKFIWSGFYAVLVGVSFHLILDYIERVQIFYYPSKISIIWDYIKSKDLKILE